jgi:hypothetical protein
MGTGVVWVRSIGISSWGKAWEGALFSAGAGVRPWAMAVPIIPSRLTAKAAVSGERICFFMGDRK